MNTCDHGHDTTHEVRLLPYGGGGNIIVCLTHYNVEMKYRRERNRELGDANQFDLPTWHALKVYSPD